MIRNTIRMKLRSYLEKPIIHLLIKLGISPNLMTSTGLLGTVISAYMLSRGELLIGGIILLVASLFDMLDGALARAINRVTDFGALFDSVIDRLSEMVLLIGLMIYYLDKSSYEGIIVVYLTFGTSLLVSYLRARAGGMGIDCELGVMTRPERIVVLSVGLVIGQWFEIAIIISLGIITLFSFITCVQRMVHISKELTRRQSVNSS